MTNEALGRSAAKDATPWFQQEEAEIHPRGPGLWGKREELSGGRTASLFIYVQNRHKGQTGARGDAGRGGI